MPKVISKAIEILKIILELLKTLKQRLGKPRQVWNPNLSIIFFLQKLSEIRL